MDIFREEDRGKRITKVRNRIIFQSENVWIGPAPYSGYHWVDSFGNFNNGANYGISGYSGYSGTTGAVNFNLVQSLSRVQSFSYSINTQKSDILALGKRSNIARPDIISPTVEIQFEYLQNSFINENRMGFNVNFTQPYGTNADLPFYIDNFSVCPISGFIDRNLIRSSNEVGYPFTYRDCRNIFLAVGSRQGFDINFNTFSGLNPNYATLNTVGFGNCYITNYKATAQVGDFPRVVCSYLGENMQIYFSGSGIPIPALNKQTRQPIPNKVFSLPTDYPGKNMLSVLLPRDITLDIYSRPRMTNRLAVDGLGTTGGYNPKILDLGTSFTDYKIQSYSINLPLNREPLNSLGWKLPVDQQINFPVYVTLDFQTIVGDLETGSLVNYLNKETEYDLVVKLKNTRPGYQQGEIVRYDFRRAVFNNFSYGDRIADNKFGNFSFVVELDPDDPSKGFYMSGAISDTLTSIQDAGMLLNGFLQQENSFYILQENSSKIVIQDFAFLG